MNFFAKTPCDYDAAPASPVPEHLPPCERGCGSHGATAMRWFVVQTKPAQEFRALRELQSPPPGTRRPDEFRAWMPVEVVRRDFRVRGVLQRDKGGRVIRKETAKAFFPNYLFVSFHPKDPYWPPLMHVYGVSRLFCTAYGQPYPMPEGFVEGLQAKGRPGDGLIDREYRGPEFPTGSTVRVVDGPFASFAAIVQMSDAERVRVLVDIFGRTTPVTLDKSQIEAV